MAHPAEPVAELPPADQPSTSGQAEPAPEAERKPRCGSGLPHACRRRRARRCRSTHPAQCSVPSASRLAPCLPQHAAGGPGRAAGHREVLHLHGYVGSAPASPAVLPATRCALCCTSQRPPPPSPLLLQCGHPVLATQCGAPASHTASLCSLATLAEEPRPQTPTAHPHSGSTLQASRATRTPCPCACTASARTA